MTTTDQVQQYHEAAEAFDGDNYPWLSPRIAHTPAHGWTANMHGKWYNFDTRRDAIMFVAGVLLAVSRHLEPNLDGIYSEPWDPNDKRSYAQYTHAHYKIVDEERAR